MARSLCFFVLLTMGTGLAHALRTPAIGVYTNLQGTQCAGNTMNGILQGSIWADGVGGITSAEFSIYCPEYSSKNLYLQFRTEPGAVSLGNPLQLCQDPCQYVSWRDPECSYGTNVGFPACQTSSRVRLFTFTLIERIPTDDIRLYVTRHGTPRTPISAARW